MRSEFAGDRFNYGSSAFAWLQRAMETTTGRSLEQLAQERIFEVFGMVDSSLARTPED